jgi:AraC-like DNA-binding protein
MKNAVEVQFDTDTDNQFYQSFLQILENHMAEPSLSVEDFTRRLGISRTQLHRKLKALTGLSVNQIVRNVRLQKGLTLVRSGKKTISEIAYEVGFNSPAYFTERFKDYYGHPPSEVEKISLP